MFTGLVDNDLFYYEQVFNKRGGNLCVDLKRPDDDEPTQDDDRPASVRDALVFLEVARFVSPASKPDGLFVCLFVVCLFFSFLFLTAIVFHKL